MKKDSITLPFKAFLRKKILKEVEKPIILETHGGYGKVWESCYQDFDEGIVFEKKPEKIAILAKQRPTWRVYECDCEMVIKEKIGSDMDINFVDIDPYGNPWEVINNLFDGYLHTDKIGIAVVDGLRQGLKMNIGWKIESLSEMVQKYGNNFMYLNYIDICRELLCEIAQRSGYKIDLWAGYYCGYAKMMTHYGAALNRS